MTEESVLLFVDEIEEDDAWLMLGDKRHRVPRAVLPNGAGEGTWLRVCIDEAPAEAKEIEARRAQLTRSDAGGKLKL
jgi:hypothetical protein